MLGLQFTQQGKITEVNKMEICESVDSSKVKIFVIPTDEEMVIAEETLKIVNNLK